MRKNVGNQTIGFQVIDTDGADVTTGNLSIVVTVDGGTQTSVGNATHEGNGAWTADTGNAANTNGNHCLFTAVHDGNGVTQSINVYPVAHANDQPTVNVGSWLGTTVATPTTAGVPEVDVTFWAGCTTFEQGGFPAVALGNTSAHGGAATSIELDQLDVNTQTNLGNLTTSLFSSISGNAANLVNVTLGNVAHGGSAATLTMASATLTGNLTAGNIAADLVGDITGNLSGSAGSVTGAVGSVTGAVGSVTGAVGSVTGNVGGSVEGNVAGSVASVTGGINTGAGTITTLDALDTAQDAQHGTTRTQLDSMSGATFDTATDSLEAIRNRGDAAWTTGAGGTPPDLMQSTTIATLASQTSFTLTAGSADDDAYNGALIVVTDQSTATQKAKATISDYTGSTRTVTLSSDPAIFTMAAGDNVAIIAVGEAVATVDEAAIADAVLDEALSGHTTAGTLGKAIADIEADATAILADTAELQTNQGNWLTATGFSTHTAANVRTEMDANSTKLALLTGNVALEATAQSILTDTAEIGAAGAGLTAAGGNGTHLTEAGGTGDHLTAVSLAADQSGVTVGTVNSLGTTARAQVNTEADTALADYDAPTKAELDSGLGALNDVSVADILTTQMTESYASDGTAPTLAQALFLIQQKVGDFSISGTTLTVKRLDGTSTAAVYTLDDATTPTSTTRTG